MGKHMDSEEWPDERLKRCPFCGAEGRVRKILLCTAKNRKGNIPDGVEVTDHWFDTQGREYVGWKKYGYTVHCMTRGCFCRNTGAKYRSVEDAITKWNQRRVD